MKATLIIILSAMGVCLAQRGSYAGRIPVGYPVMDPTTTTTTVSAPTTGAVGALGGSSSSSGALGNRLGNDIISPVATTMKIPIEANGDMNLIQRLSQLPIDKQPFWLINWKALEELRSQPHSYPVSDNRFIDFGSTPNRRNNNIQQYDQFF